MSIVKIYTDGGCSNNGQDWASGVCVVYHEGIVYEEEFKPYSISNTKITNNVMEYMGIKYALKYIYDNNIRNCTVSCDNKMVVYSFTRHWKIKSSNLKEIFRILKHRLAYLKDKGFDIKIIWEPRELNLAGHYIEDKHGL